MKKSIMVAAMSTVLGIGAMSSALADSAPDPSGAGGEASKHSARTSGVIVIAWNKELLRIIQTKGAQPTNIHPTRSFAILHAAIYDSIVSITRDAPP